MIKIIPKPVPITPKIRSDRAGDGHYGAPRGTRKHTGIDYEAPAESRVLSPVDGLITAHGHAYNSDLLYRIIDITDADGYIHRLFYCELYPELLGREVSKNDTIGVVQDISAKYPDSGMVNHLHYCIRDIGGEYMDPAEYWDAH